MMEQELIGLILRDKKKQYEYYENLPGGAFVPCPFRQRVTLSSMSVWWNRYFD